MGLHKETMKWQLYVPGIQCLEHHTVQQVYLTLDAKVIILPSFPI